MLSTTGFTIYSHHCSKNGTNYSLSYSSSTSECEQCAEISHAEITVSSCCTSKHKCETEQTSDNCCSDNERFIKIDVEYNIPTINNTNQPVTLDLFALCLMESDRRIIEVSDNKVNNYSLPPPKSGADIIVFLSQQKTDPAPIA